MFLFPFVNVNSAPAYCYFCRLLFNSYVQWFSLCSLVAKSAKYKVSFPKTLDDITNDWKILVRFFLNRKSLRIVEAGPLGLGGQFFTINKRRRVLHSSRTQSASEICHFALVSFLSYLQLRVIYVFYVLYCGRLVSSMCST